MKTIRRNIFLALLLAGAMALSAPHHALAAIVAGTASNVDINNMATLQYTVSGNTYNLESAPGAGNSTPNEMGGNGSNTTFKVDDKVIFTVTANDAGAVSVLPNGTRAMKFTVANVGNTTHDFVMTLTELSDTITVAGALYEDTNGTGTFEAAADKPAGDGAATYLKISGPSTYIDELSADDAASANQKVIFVVITAPTTATNGQGANYQLKATAYQSAGAGNLGAISAESGAPDDPALVDIVLADAASDAADAARNGTYTKNGVTGFQVISAVITITKTATTIWDPVSMTTLPKAIPGALIRYIVTVENDAASGASATLTTISDGLSANLAIDADLKVAAASTPITALSPENAVGDGFKVVIAGSTRAQNNVSQYFSTANDADGVEHNAGTISATMGTILPAEAGPGYAIGELKAGETITITFNAVVQ